MKEHDTMTPAARTAFTTHVVRLLISLVLSFATLVVLMVSLRTWSALRDFTLWALPLSVAVGFAPMMRWYGRDAYPIGLVYCPTVFFLLRYLSPFVRPTL